MAVSLQATRWGSSDWKRSGGLGAGIRKTHLRGWHGGVIEPRVVFPSKQQYYCQRAV